MEQFVRRKNIERFRGLLDRVTDEEQRNQIQRLLAKEEASEVALMEAMPRT